MSNDVKPVTMERGCVLGGGAFGTALAMLLVHNGANDVRIWHPNEKEVHEINKARENKKYLPNVKLPPAIKFTTDVEWALFASQESNPEVIIFAIPTQFFRGFLEQNKKLLMSNLHRCKVALVASKGIENKTLRLPSQIVEDVLGKDTCRKRLAVVAGPSFAKEVADGKLTGVTVAARNIKLARVAQALLTTPDGMFRCFATAPDVITCEVASSVKNVIAIAAGAADGLGMGRNARAYIITRGLIEIVLLARALGTSADQEQLHALPAVLSLAGVGDVVLTCSSSTSRNYSVGQRLGKGESLADIKKNMTAVAEGVATAESIAELSRNVGSERLVLCDAVNDVLRGKLTTKEAMEKLINPKLMPLTDEPIMNEIAKKKGKAKL
jgi:glycerol-3-phosphate dehydrogenase